MEAPPGLVGKDPALSAKEREALALLPDEALAARAGRGEVLAFELLASRWWARLGRLAASSAGLDPVLAEEVAQDALIRIHRALPGFRGDSSFSTFAWRIVRNSACDALRGLGRERRRRVLAEDSLAALPYEGRGPEELLVRKAETEALAELLGALSTEERILLHLHESEGIDIAQLARIFGLPLGTVKSRLFRLRARLAARLEEDGYGP